ncbi:MAG: hypothetical protein CMJ81_16680 [Planctomycetaceae bacterium]|nr:hypothetical protein [Planctomycetaceae bacterium]
MGEYMADPEGPRTKEDLHRFIDLVADSGVDTYLQNINSQVPWYPSRRTPNILTGYRRGDREFFRKHFRAGLSDERLDPALDESVAFLNRYLDLAEQGVNWIDEISGACRRRGISPWASFRMNDMHGANNWEGSYMTCQLQKDPKYRLKGLPPNPRDGVNRYLQSLDYSHREVRDYMLLVMREIVEDHDYEGLELDWLRCPFCIDPPATQANIDTMTNWIAEIRELTDARAKLTGRPYRLGLRIPSRLGLLKAIGLDIQAIVRRGLVDFVSFSNYWQTSWDEPLDDLRTELGDEVAIYGVVATGVNWMPAYDPVRKEQASKRLMSASAELLRGNAAGKLALGADGIAQFNFFANDARSHNPAAGERQSEYAALKDLEEIEHLRGKDKHYALASRLCPYNYDFPLWEHAEQTPAILEPDWKGAFRLPMCAEPDARALELLVQVVTERSAGGDSEPTLGVSFNGSWPSFDGQSTDQLLFPTGIYTQHVAGNLALNFRCDPATIREGWNEVLVFNGSHQRATAAERQAHSVKIVGIELAVQRKTAR